jgi:hypothetical protein
MKSFSQHEVFSRPAFARMGPSHARAIRSSRSLGHWHGAAHVRRSPRSYLGGKRVHKPARQPTAGTSRRDQSGRDESQASSSEFGANPIGSDLPWRDCPSTPCATLVSAPTVRPMFKDLFSRRSNWRTPVPRPSTRYDFGQEPSYLKDSLTLER